MIQISYSYIYLLFIYLVISHILYITTKILTKHAQDKTLKLFILPIMFLCIPIFIIINQCTNYLCNLDQPLGSIFKHLKIPEEIVDYITIYLLIEIVMIVLYISILLLNRKNKNILNFFCEEATNNIDNKCVKNVHEQIFVYVNFFRVVTILTFISIHFFMKAKEGNIFTLKHLVKNDKANDTIKLQNTTKYERQSTTINNVNQPLIDIKKKGNNITETLKKKTNNITEALKKKTNNITETLKKKANNITNIVRSKVAKSK